MGNENSTQSVEDSNDSPSKRRDQITSRGQSAASKSSSTVDWANVAVAATAITAAVGAACYAASAYKERVERDQENENEFSDSFRAESHILVKESQDKKPLLGYFKCHSCKHGWKSAFAWENFGQKCEKCLGGYVYPYKTERLSKFEGNRNSKPHPEDLCEKCRVYGRPCYKWYNPNDFF